MEEGYHSTDTPTANTPSKSQSIIPGRLPTRLYWVSLTHVWFVEAPSDTHALPGPDSRVILWSGLLVEPPSDTHATPSRLPSDTLVWPARRADPSDTHMQPVFR